MDEPLPPSKPENAPECELAPLEAGQARVHIEAELGSDTVLQVRLETSTTDGKVVARQTVILPPGKGSTLSITTPGGDEIPAVESEPAGKLTAWFGKARQFATSLAGRLPKNWENWAMGAALALYLITRLIGLGDFPIYFFTDEAVQTVLAQDFVRDGFRNYDDDLFPTYFQNVYQYNLSTSVYLQVIPYLLFGKSIEVTRGVSVLVTLLAAYWVGKILKDIFKVRFPWIGVLVLSVTPVWFLHSRTAFETALAVTFFSGFLYYYLLYRGGSQRAFYWAALLGALVFYTYSPGQMIMAFSIVLLFFSDLRYHWQNRKTVLRGLLLGVILAVPYIRFQIQHPGESLRHLTQLNSYWVQTDLTLGDKLLQFLKNYLAGLNPLYWYLPNTTDFVRHVMDSFGHLWRVFLPFGLGGIVISALRVRDTRYRTLLMALLVAPSGAALVGLEVTRALFMVIPAALLTAVAIEWTIDWLGGRVKLSRTGLGAGVSVGLAVFNVYLLINALTQGPVWFDQYGLGGLQWGAKQVFGAVQAYQAEHPGVAFYITPTWANGTDILKRFFFSDSVQGIELGSIDTYINNYTAIKPDLVLVMAPEEVDRAKESGKFADVTPLQVIHYPNGLPGFYFTQIRYVDNIQDIFAAETAKRYDFLTADVTVAGTPATMKYYALDMGSPGDLFDGNLNSLVRSEYTNPFIIEIDLSQPIKAKGVQVQVGGVQTELTITAVVDGSKTPQEFTGQVGSSAHPQPLVVNFNNELNLTHLTLKVYSVGEVEPAHVHVWEVTLLQ